MTPDNKCPTYNLLHFYALKLSIKRENGGKGYFSSFLFAENIKKSYFCNGVYIFGKFTLMTHEKKNTV